MDRFNNVIFGQKAFVINDKNEILILKRGEHELYDDMWDIPGGKLEDNDTLIESIAREVKEETGLEIADVVAIITSSKFTGNVQDKPFVFRNIYLVRANGEIALSVEHKEYKWVSSTDLANYQFPPDQDFQEALKIIAANNLGNLTKISKII